MHLAFDIFTGIGVAAAIGIRPFLPAVLVSVLALAHLDGFRHTDFHFLQTAPFIIGMAVGVVALLVLERAAAKAWWLCAGFSVVLGALYFGGELCRGGYAVWPGLVGGVICASVGVAAARPFLARLRSRLDAEAAAVGVPLVSEGSALLLAGLSVLAPPVGVIGLLALLWLLYRGRGRDEQKYAGLRILR